MSAVKGPFTWPSKLAIDIDSAEEAEMWLIERGDDNLEYLESKDSDGDHFGTQSRPKKRKHAKFVPSPSSNAIEVGLRSESPLNMADSQDVYEFSKMNSE